MRALSQLLKVGYVDLEQCAPDMLVRQRVPQRVKNLLGTAADADTQLVRSEQCSGVRCHLPHHNDSSQAVEQLTNGDGTILPTVRLSQCYQSAGQQ